MTERELILQGWDAWSFRPEQLGHLCLYDWAMVDAWNTISELTRHQTPLEPEFAEALYRDRGLLYMQI